MPGTAVCVDCLFACLPACLFAVLCYRLTLYIRQSVGYQGRPRCRAGEQVLVKTVSLMPVLSRQYKRLAKLKLMYMHSLQWELHSKCVKLTSSLV